jgi:hypothetical protein
MLEQLVYASAAVGSQSDSVLNTIFETAQRNNARDTSSILWRIPTQRPMDN